MKFYQFNEALRMCFRKNSLEYLLDDDKAAKFYDFANILIETNKVMNLTAIADLDGIIFKHFCDSAKVCEHISAGASVIDVGCGAGFPSLPLAILRPDLKVTALDSTAKKIAFIEKTAEAIGVNNIMAVAARAEDFAKKNFESFDFATSRAVARLNVLCELCIPLIKAGGAFVPLKASQALDELNEAKNAIKTLGARLKSTNDYSLTYGGEVLDRHIFEIVKHTGTDKKYPREYRIILKKPL